MAINREDFVKIKQCLLLPSIYNIFTVLNLNNAIFATLKLRKNSQKDFCLDPGFYGAIIQY